MIFTEAGKKFVAADILERKQIFANHLLEHISLAKYIRSLIDAASNQKVSEEVILEELENYLSDDEAERVLRIIIDWGRYAEIFAYNYDTGELSLENPQ